MKSFREIQGTKVNFDKLFEIVKESVKNLQTKDIFRGS